MLPKGMLMNKGLKGRILLSKSAQQEIKSYILRNSLKPGDPLPTEAQLAIQLKMSRTSIREAVKSLEAIGIIEAFPGYGLYVREFSFDPFFENLPYGILFALKRLAEIQEIRFHIEMAIADKIIQNITPNQLERMNVLLEQMRVSVAAGTYPIELDRAGSVSSIV